MIETLQSLPMPVQIVFAVVFAVTVVLSAIVIYVLVELETDDYWRRLK